MLIMGKEDSVLNFIDELKKLEFNLKVERNVSEYDLMHWRIKQ
jgi:hypothetical protein